MIANMAMSNLLFPIFLFPLNLVELQADTWHIRDPLYQNLGKIGFFLSTISAAMSIQSLILIASGSIWSCCSPNPFPAYQ